MNNVRATKCRKSLDDIEKLEMRRGTAQRNLLTSKSRVRPEANRWWSEEVWLAALREKCKRHCKKHSPHFDMMGLSLAIGKEGGMWSWVELSNSTMDQEQ